VRKRLPRRSPDDIYRVVGQTVPRGDFQQIAATLISS
jgi:hypothetical protein